MPSEKSICSSVDARFMTGFYFTKKKRGVLKTINQHSRTLHLSNSVDLRNREVSASEPEEKEQKERKTVRVIALLCNFGRAQVPVRTSFKSASRVLRPNRAASPAALHTRVQDLFHSHV